MESTLEPGLGPEPESARGRPVATPPDAAHVISLTAAGQRLGGRSPEYVKGCCDVYGVPLTRIGCSVAMRIEDFDRLVSDHPHIRRTKSPRVRKRSKMAV